MSAEDEFDYEQSVREMMRRIEAMETEIRVGFRHNQDVMGIVIGDTKYMIDTLNEYLPMIRKFAVFGSIGSGKSAEKVRGILGKNKHGKSGLRSEDGSGEEGGGADRRIVPDEDTGGTGEGD